MSPWPTLRLADCTDIVSGATPNTSEPAYWDGDVYWATPRDLSELEGAYISDTLRKITQRGLESCGASVLPPESVLFSSRAPIGHVAINTVPMATNQGFKSFVPDRRRVHPKFLYHWLRKNRPYLESLGNGATFKEVSKAVVSRVEIPLPPLSEQRRIAEILDKADALREKRRAAIAQLDTLTQAIFLDIFGDPATNPKRWPTVRLRESTSRIQIGPFGSLLHQKDYVEGGVPLVNPTHIQAGEIRPDPSETISDHKFAELSTYHLQVGDVVMGRRGKMGRCAVVNEGAGPLLCGTGSLFIRPDKGQTTSLYLVSLLSGSALKSRLERLSLGQTLPNLNSEIVERLEVPLPPLDRQLEFADQVTTTRRLVATEANAATWLDSLFASLQYRAFRGDL